MEDRGQGVYRLELWRDRDCPRLYSSQMIDELWVVYKLQEARSKKKAIRNSQLATRQYSKQKDPVRPNPRAGPRQRKRNGSSCKREE